MPIRNSKRWAFHGLVTAKKTPGRTPMPPATSSESTVSTKRDGRIQRVEHYKNATLVRADEDTDGDGKPDKWETYDGDRLAMVAYDTLHRGTADRRLIYGVDGRAQLEVDAKGNGTWTPR
jgi:hypothetical protein